MAKRCEPLGVAVPEYNGKGYKGQVKTKRIDPPGAKNKGGAGDQDKEQGLISGNHTGGDFAQGSPRIDRIEAQVQPTVKGHRGAAREYHAQQDQEKPEQNIPAHGPGARMVNRKKTQTKADQRKGHGENSMRESDQPEIIFYLAHGSIL
jgi:hypothetical protein